MSLYIGESLDNKAKSQRIRPVYEDGMRRVARKLIYTLDDLTIVYPTEEDESHVMYIGEMMGFSPHQF